eukprot:3895750-Prorocentrum_lima.AAC.1
MAAVSPEATCSSSYGTPSSPGALPCCVRMLRCIRCQEGGGSKGVGLPPLEVVVEHVLGKVRGCLCLSPYGGT